MLTYISVRFTVTPTYPFTDILVQELGDIGFEMFEEQDNGTKGYIQSSNFDEHALQSIAIFSNSKVAISYEIEEIPAENWNLSWEKYYPSVSISDDCAIRAPFHPPNTEVLYDLIIHPKMSFGTGHHETTTLILQTLLTQNLQNKQVLDMGCGTGVLAILAEKMGAKQIVAIDIDAHVIDNVLENITLNNCKKIIPYKRDEINLQITSFDVILANINRNVLMDDIGLYKNWLRPKGLLIISGFYEDDLPILNNEAKQNGLTFLSKKIKNKWVCSIYKGSSLK